MVVREAVYDDLSQIMELYRFLNPDDPQYDENSLKTAWEEIMQSGHIRYFVAEEAGRLLSTCNIAIIPNLTRAVRPFAVIENVVTHQDAKRKGYGRAVMEKAIEYARVHNCYKVMLLSSSYRPEAHQFYENLGFDGTKKKGYVYNILK